MIWTQQHIRLQRRPRGIHLVTAEVLGAIPEVETVAVGLLNIFIRHTSASLAINENADPDVRHDVEAHINRMVPENAPYYRHTMEGPDDMPAHIKAMFFGSSLVIPISEGRVTLGTWQGIYLCEHRDHAGERSLVVTLNGRRFDAE